MIDTHCHLLPGLDDGPVTVDEAVELASLLVRQGVEVVVCTPHLSRQHPVTRADARASLLTLQQALVRHRIDLRMVLAAEVTDVNAVSLDITALRELSVSGRFLIVEFNASATAWAVESVARRMVDLGLVPVIAHPERLGAYAREPEMIEGARALGALVQVVAPSLTGQWGETVARVAWELLAAGRADIVASDAHGVGRRSPCLDAARELVVGRLGTARWDELTAAAPARMLEGVDD